MPEGPVRRPCDPHAPASRCTRQPIRNAEIEPASFSRRGHAVVAFRRPLPPDWLKMKNLNAPAVKPPAEMVDKLNNEINAGLADPKMKARLADLGEIPFPGSPADFGKFIAADTEKWAKVVKFTGIKAD